jgi:MFS family permease
MSKPADPSLQRLWTPTFWTFLFINLCIFLGFNMLLPTLSLYLDAEGCSEREIGLVFGIFTLTSVAARLSANRLNKRFGALRVARFGLFICAVGTPFFFLFHDLPSYLAARLAQGAGFGVTSTLLVTLASRTIPPARLGEGMGYLGLGATVSMALGPYLGIILVSKLGFVALFLATSFSYLAATMVSLALPHIELPSIALSKDEKGFQIEWKALRPAIIIFIFGIAGASVTSYLAIYFDEKHLPSAAMFFMVSTLGTLVSRVTVGKIFDSHGHVFVVPPAIFLMFVALGSITFTPSYIILLVAAILYGLGAGALFPATQTLSLSSVPLERRTVASAYFFVALDIGIGLGSLAMGHLAGFFGTYQVTFVFALFALVGMGAYYFWSYIIHKPQSPSTI